MKNITVSLDDEVYRRARVAAAAHETSVSALVRDYLQSLATEESRFDRLKRREQELREQIKDFDGGNRLSRDEVHERQA